MRHKIVKLAAVTSAIWLAAFLGWYGVAVTLAFAALLYGAWVALESLMRDGQCHVCGRSYDHGRLGMCSTCANELRPVRR